MFDLWNLPAPGTGAAGAPAADLRQAPAPSEAQMRGPARTEAGLQRLAADLLLGALDAVDYGMALVCADGEVLHLNRRARQALGQDAPLQVMAGSLRATHTQDLLRLHAALHDATQRGRRRMLGLGDAASRLVCALVPVQPGVAVLLLGRSDSGTMLSIECLAQLYGLTAAETRVLRSLSRGLTPVDIAREQGVKLCTVRTQIGTLRGKTDTPSITALVRLVSGLPPMANALRGH